MLVVDAGTSSAANCVCVCLSVCLSVSVYHAAHKSQEVCMLLASQLLDYAV